MDTDLIVRKVKENKVIAIATGAILLIIIVLLVSAYGKKSSTPLAPGPVDIVGEFACLPYKEDVKENTCSLGLKDGRNYFAMDVSTITLAVTDLKANDDIEVKGEYVPIETLSSDTWSKYDIKGIIRVDSLTRAK